MTFSFLRLLISEFEILCSIINKGTKPIKIKIVNGEYHAKLKNIALKKARM